ncbi:hypothetical protein KI387_014176, partial [Taxus chinensis]
VREVGFGPHVEEGQSAGREREGTSEGDRGGALNGWRWGTVRRRRLGRFWCGSAGSGPRRTD